MNRLKAIAAVYLGIYLILPGCLCQILGAFGLKEESPPYHTTTEITARLASDTPCHCHEVSGKVAESPLATTALPVLAFACFESSDLGQEIPNLLLRADLNSGRAPPDPATFPSHSLRFFTGVFRI